MTMNLRFGFDFLEHLNYDRYFILELDIRLKLLAERLHRSKSYWSVIRHNIASLVQYHGNLKQARTEALLVTFLEDSLFYNQDGVRCWSNAIAKRLAEDLKPFFSSQWQIMKSKQDLRSLEYWKPAYCMPVRADVGEDVNKKELEAKVRYEVIQLTLKKYNKDQNKYCEKYGLNKRYSIFSKLKVDSFNLGRIARDIVSSLDFLGNNKYTKDMSMLFQAVDSCSYTFKACKGNNKLTTNPVVNMFDYIRHIRNWFSYQLQSKNEHPHLVELLDLLEPV